MSPAQTSIPIFPFLALLKIPAEQFKLVLDSIVWAFKHTMRNVADTGEWFSLQFFWN